MLAVANWQRILVSGSLSGPLPQKAPSELYQAFLYACLSFRQSCSPELHTRRLSHGQQSECFSRSLCDSIVIGWIAVDGQNPLFCMHDSVRRRILPCNYALSSWSSSMSSSSLLPAMFGESRHPSKNPSSYSWLTAAAPTPSATTVSAPATNPPPKLMLSLLIIYSGRFRPF